MFSIRSLGVHFLVAISHATSIKRIMALFSIRFNTRCTIYYSNAHTIYHFSKNKHNPFNAHFDAIRTNANLWRFGVKFISRDTSASLMDETLCFHSETSLSATMGRPDVNRSRTGLANVKTYPEMRCLAAGSGRHLNLKSEEHLRAPECFWYIYCSVRRAYRAISV